MSVTFAVKAHTFSLYKAIKEEAEKLGWVYYEDFVEFKEEIMERCNCLYFSNEWPDYNNELRFAFSNHETKDKRFYLPGDWNIVIDHLKELNPAQGAVINTMQDPNVKQPDELKANEAQNQVAPAEQATEQESAEEGSVEG